MKERLRALDMFEKFHAKSLPFRSTFDESGNIGDDEAVIGAEVGLECRKWVIAHLCCGSRELVDETRLARVGQSHKPYVCDEAQFEPIGCHIALRALLEIFGRRVGTGAEFEIPASAVASACREYALAHMRELARVAVPCVHDARPRRHLECEIFPIRAVDKLPAAIPAILGLYFLAAPGGPFGLVFTHPPQTQSS